MALRELHGTGIKREIFEKSNTIFNDFQLSNKSDSDSDEKPFPSIISINSSGKNSLSLAISSRTDSSWVCNLNSGGFLSDFGFQKPIYDGIGTNLSPHFALIPGIAAKTSFFAQIASVGPIRVVMLSGGRIPMLFAII